MRLRNKQVKDIKMNVLSPFVRKALLLNISGPQGLLEVMSLHHPSELTTEEMQSVCNTYVFRDALFSRDAFEDMCGEKNIAVLYQNHGYMVKMFEEEHVRVELYGWLVGQLIGQVQQAAEELRERLFA
jgi:hypothetical protein